MSSMSSHDADVPVEQRHRYSGSQPADIGHELEDEQESVVDEDVVVIETHDAVDDREPVASEQREASPGTICSAAASGPAEPVAEEPSAGEPVEDAGQWSEIKAMFVDDPGESVKRASGMVDRAMENLMISLRERQESLASWHANDATGTEELRNALRGYQSLFNQLDAMSDRFRTGPDRVGSA